MKSHDTFERFVLMIAERQNCSQKSDFIFPLLSDAANNVHYVCHQQTTHFFDEIQFCLSLL